MGKEISCRFDCSPRTQAVRNSFASGWLSSAFFSANTYVQVDYQAGRFLLLLATNDLAAVAAAVCLATLQ